MKNEIKTIYTKFTNKQLESDDSIIADGAFNSVLFDRFKSELRKRGINWDGKPTTINKLLSTDNKNTNVKSSPVSAKSNPVNDGSGKLKVGVDIQLIKNIPIVKDPWEDAFYIDNFSKSEISHCLKKQNPFESFAGIFAAKEAVFKASGIERAQVEITFTVDNKPECELAAVSISHDNEYAIAITVIENKIIPKSETHIQSSANTSDKKSSNKLGIIAVSLLVIYILYREVFYTVIHDFIHRVF